jgi:uncharacterized protein (DUF3084 family)
MKLIEAKQVHDALLAMVPEGESHDPCELCSVTSNETAAEESAPAIRKEDNSMDPIYTQEQADSLVEAAVTKANEVAAAALEAAMANKDAEMAELKTELADVQAKRDQDQVELAAAQTKVTELEGEIARRDEEVAKEARKSERLDAVAELKAFSEKYIEENTARWVDMTDEQFASFVEQTKDMASAIVPATTSETVVPEETAMNNETVEETASQSKVKSFFSETLKGGIQ